MFAAISIKLFIHVTKIPISLPPVIRCFHVAIIFIFGSNWLNLCSRYDLIVGKGVKDFLTSTYFSFEFLVPINCAAWVWDGVGGKYHDWRM